MDFPAVNPQNGYIAYPFLTTRLPWWSGARLGLAGTDLYGRPVPPSERLTELELSAVAATVQSLESRVSALEARLLSLTAPPAPPLGPSPTVSRSTVPKPKKMVKRRKRRRREWL